MNKRTAATSSQDAMPVGAARVSLREWWLQRLEQELQPLLFAGILRKAHAPRAPTAAAALTANSDPGALLVQAVPRRPLTDPESDAWGDHSELITDWFHQGNCLAQRLETSDDAPEPSFARKRSRGATCSRHREKRSQRALARLWRAPERSDRAGS